MCLTGFYLNPSPSPGGFKFVMVFNRDEYYNRPTIPAEFWEGGSVIGGRDTTPGKEGGTWLGMSKTGRIGCLLNIFQSEEISADGKGRGFLVTDFLKSDVHPQDYVTTIHKECNLYNPFSVILMDLSSQTGAYYYSNKSDKSSATFLPEGFYGVSNSALDKTWPKANHIKSKLEEIVRTNPTRTHLIERLFKLLHTEISLLGEPPVLKLSDMNDKFVASLGQFLPGIPFVKFPGYGTRSSTVIVIDDKDEVTFVEKYLEEPIDPTGANHDWKIKTHSFQLIPLQKL